MLTGRKRAGSRSDLIDGLIEKQVELGISDSALSTNAATLVGAGSDTTAAGVLGTIYLILAHPKAHARVKREILSAFSHKNEITVKTVSQLNFLMACILESLRLYPPSMNGNTRKTTATQTIGKWTVPAGTLVETMQWAINHEPQNWNDPWAFKPERFIIEEDKDGNVIKTYQPFMKADNKEGPNVHGDRVETLQPFSVGPRNCLGRRYVAGSVLVCVDLLDNLH